MTWIVLLIFAFGLIVSPCMAQTSASTRPADVAADNSFAADLYSHLTTATPSVKGNLFLSPYSIRTALAMTWAGARGDTARQMATVLHLSSMQAEQLHPAFAALIKQLNGDSKNFELSVANALWGQTGYGFRAEYKDLLRTSYSAELLEVDFIHQPDPARLQINAWAEQKTHDKIKDLLAPGAIDTVTRLVLTNAIYFKAAWETPFNKQATSDQPFHLDTARDVPVPTMHRGAQWLNFAETDQFQAVEVPYQELALSMILIVPKSIDGLGQIEKSITGDALQQWSKAMQGRMVALALPKFRMTSEFRLAEQLQAMGMTDAFNADRADFSGIITGDQSKKEPPPVISEVIHKAFVATDEDGTEAAAATAVVMRAGSAAPNRLPTVVTADRPFLFYIRHRASGVILFMGRVVDPRS